MFGLTFTYFVVEVVGGLVTNSLALLADAAHMLPDVGGLGLALFAASMSKKPATPQRTYGYYRVEILAALTNAVVLFLIAFFILFEAYRRFRRHPARRVQRPTTSRDGPHLADCVRPARGRRAPTPPQHVLRASGLGPLTRQPGDGFSFPNCLIHKTGTADTCSRGASAGERP